MSYIQIGELYLVKSYNWFLFPAKEQAAFAGQTRDVTGWWASTSIPQSHAKWFSQEFKCNVSFFEPKTYVVLLEVNENEGCYKLLDCNGNIGWIYCPRFSKYFELVKAK